MTTKQAAPIAVTVATAFAAVPPLLVFGGIIALAIWVLSSDDKNQPEKTPGKAASPHTRSPKLFNSSGNSAQNAHIPADYVPATPEIQLPAQKKFIVRADMEKIFNGRTRGLTRTEAVSALKALGFGKTAAYAALSPDGRFSACLHCAPDGIITWKS